MVSLTRKQICERFQRQINLGTILQESVIELCYPWWSFKSKLHGWIMYPNAAMQDSFHSHFVFLFYCNTNGSFQICLRVLKRSKICPRYWRKRFQIRRFKAPAPLVSVSKMGTHFPEIFFLVWEDFAKADFLTTLQLFPRSSDLKARSYWISKITCFYKTYTINLL